MSEKMDAAIKFLTDASAIFGKHADSLVENIANEDFAKVNEVYKTAAKLSVLASQFSKQVYQGNCELHNSTASVMVDGFPIRDRIIFEVMVDGQWVRGHRENSPYGQVFVTAEGSSFILTNEHLARVQCPLDME